MVQYQVHRFMESGTYGISITLVSSVLDDDQELKLHLILLIGSADC